MTPRLGQTILYNYNGILIPAQVTHIFNENLINLNAFPEHGRSYNTYTSVQRGNSINEWDYNFDADKESLTDDDPVDSSDVEDAEATGN